jgi:DNA uptake protein ComE-like DNA-binding protein
MVALNTAPEKELVSFYGVSPEEAARIVAARPFTSIQDARDRAGLSEEALADIRQGAQAKEPQPIQPTA